AIHPRHLLRGARRDENHVCSSRGTLLLGPRKDRHSGELVVGHSPRHHSHEGLHARRILVDVDTLDEAVMYLENRTLRALDHVAGRTMPKAAENLDVDVPPLRADDRRLVMDIIELGEHG